MTKNKRKMRGQWDTFKSPFHHPPAKEWLAEVKRFGLAVVEPFVGAGNLVRMLPDVNWQGFFDIEPRCPNGMAVVRQDTIADFPVQNCDGIKFRAVITNPPWLARHKAEALGIQFSNKACFDDLYKEALAACLENSEWVAAIVPESFISSLDFLDRLWAVVSIPYDIFDRETEHPVCLALFVPVADGNPAVWRGDTYLGHLSDLKDHPVLHLKKKDLLLIDYCDPAGEIGLIAMDSRSGQTIRFVEGSEIDPGKVKRSSRHIVRAKLPMSVDHAVLEALIEDANKMLSDFRTKTCDVTLTATRSRRRGGLSRRRLDFDTATRILTLCWIATISTGES